jgi:hypothetical protein
VRARIVKITTLTTIMCFSTSANATLVNWNAIEVNDVEYYVQTDKSTYLLGEDVEMLYRITNLGQESITYTVGWSPIWNFWAETGGQHIWTGMYSKLAVVTSLTIEPGESVEFPEYNSPFTWDLRDDAGDLVQPGEYNVVGGIDHPEDYYAYTKVPVQIEVIPEPATLLLLAIGAVWAQATMRQKHGSAEVRGG